MLPGSGGIKSMECRHHSIPNPNWCPWLRRRKISNEQKEVYNSQNSSTSRFGYMEFIFGLDFHAFFIKQRKQQCQLCLQIWFTLAFTRQGIPSLLPFGQDKIHRHTMSWGKNLIWKGGASRTTLLLVWTLLLWIHCFLSLDTSFLFSKMGNRSQIILDLLFKVTV